MATATSASPPATSGAALPRALPLLRAGLSALRADEPTGSERLAGGWWGGWSLAGAAALSLRSAASLARRRTDGRSEKMAEASAAAVPQHRFFCHSCKGEVSPKLPVSAGLGPGESAASAP